MVNMSIWHLNSFGDLFRFRCCHLIDNVFTDNKSLLSQEKNQRGWASKSFSFLLTNSYCSISLPQRRIVLDILCALRCISGRTSGVQLFGNESFAIFEAINYSPREKNVWFSRDFNKINYFWFYPKYSSKWPKWKRET